MRPLLVGLLLGLLIAPASSASAHQLPSGCDTYDDLDTAALQFDGYYPSGGFRETANGMAGGIEGFDVAHCRRIASLIIVNNGDYNNFIEVGILMGHSYTAGCLAGAWRNVATVFRAWQISSIDPPNCVVHTGKTMVDGEWRNFQISDANSNLTWHFYFTGIELGTAAMNFTDGFANVLGERHNVHDVSGASFRNLEWILYSSLIPWDNARKNTEIVGNENAWRYDIGATNFYCVKVSNTEINVRSSTMGSECPDPP